MQPVKLTALGLAVKEGRRWDSLKLSIQLWFLLAQKRLRGSLLSTECSEQESASRLR